MKISLRAVAVLMLSLPVMLGLTAGCADPVVTAEVLQLRTGDRVYLRYNLWFLDPENIDCRNIQKGSFLPVGTEIFPVGTSKAWLSDHGTITFKDAADRSYTINYDPGYRLQTMRDFIAATFTVTPPEEQLSGIPDASRQRILQGQVVPGMSRREVLLAYGPPPAVRTPNMRNETWFYWLDDSATVRVVFRGDEVRNLFNIDDL